MSTSGTPITVVGGYLGAGKTTIIRQLLEHVFDDGQQRRIAVLVNDFGDVNIDASRIARQTDDVIELANGCVCCSLVDGFVETLDAIAAWPEPPDHLVIEPSGVADPMSVAQYAYLPGFRLAGVAVAVDADALPSQLDDKRIGPSIRRQIERGDLLLLTKTDLVSPATLADTRETLAGLTDGPIIDVVEGQLNPIVLLGLDSSQQRVAADAAELHDTASEVSHEAGKKVGKEAGDEADHLSLDATTVTLRPTPPDQKAELERWLASAPSTVVRAKGSAPDGTGGMFDLDVVGSRRRVTHRIAAADNDAVADARFVVLAGTIDATVTEWLASRSLQSDAASQSSTES